MYYMRQYTISRKNFECSHFYMEYYTGILLKEADDM